MSDLRKRKAPEEFGFDDPDDPDSFPSFVIWIHKQAERIRQKEKAGGIYILDMFEQVKRMVHHPYFAMINEETQEESRIAITYVVRNFKMHMLESSRRGIVGKELELGDLEQTLADMGVDNPNEAREIGRPGSIKIEVWAAIEHKRQILQHLKKSRNELEKFFDHLCSLC